MCFKKNQEKWKWKRSGRLGFEGEKTDVNGELFWWPLRPCSLFRKCSYLGQVAKWAHTSQNCAWLQSEGGGCWTKDTKLEILKEGGLGAICWQYVSFCVFSHVSQARNLETTFLLLPCQECSAYILNPINELSSCDIWRGKWGQAPFCLLLWEAQLWSSWQALSSSLSRCLVCLWPTEDHLCDLQWSSAGSWLGATHLLTFKTANPKVKVFHSSGFHWFYKHLNTSIQSLPVWPAKRGLFFPEQIPTDSEVCAGRGVSSKRHIPS